NAVHLGRSDILGAAAIHHVTKVRVAPAAVVCAGQALLAQPATHPRRKHHLLPHLEVCYQLADLGDLARDVAAGNVGHGESDAWQAAPHPRSEEHTSELQSR